MAMRLRRLVVLLAAFALAAGLSVVTGVAAQADLMSPSPGSTGAWYEIYAPLINHSGYYRCLDVPYASVKPYQAVQTYHCHGYDSSGANQRWKFWPNGDGSYQIQNVNSQQCLQVLPYGAQPLWQYYCDGLQNERWRIIPGIGGQFELTTLALTGYCMAVYNFSGDSSTVWLQPCNPGGALLTWQLG